MVWKMAVKVLLSGHQGIEESKPLPYHSHFTLLEIRRSAHWIGGYGAPQPVWMWRQIEKSLHILEYDFVQLPVLQPIIYEFQYIQSLDFQISSFWCFQDSILFWGKGIQSLANLHAYFMGYWTQIPLDESQGTYIPSPLGSHMDKWWHIWMCVS